MMGLEGFWFNYTMIILEFLLELGIFCALFCAKLTRRSRFALRVAGCVAALVALAAGVSVFYTLFGQTVSGRVLVYVALFALVAGGGMALFQESPWTVLFCVGGAYAVQNLTYALYSLQYDLGRYLGIYRFGGDVLGRLSYRVMYYAVFALLAAGAYRLAIRPMRQKLAAGQLNQKILAIVLVTLAVSVLLCSASDILFQAAEVWAAGNKPLFALRQTTTALSAVCGGLILLAFSNTLEQQSLQRERDYDPLTGLLSRRAFYGKLDALFARPSDLRKGALVMLDLDNLKFFNDHYGHDCGDAYIRKAGECFARSAPKNTVCARVSGDEFFLLFYGYRDAAALDQALEQFSKAIQANTFHPAGGEPVAVSASGGIARYPQDATDAQTLMKYADFAMYQVKRGRKGQMGSFDPVAYAQESCLDKSRQEFLELVREEKVFFHFQPIVDARTGEIFGYESLMRTHLPALQDPQAILDTARGMGRLEDVEVLTWLRAPYFFQRLLETGQAEPTAYLFVNSLTSQHMPPRAIARFRSEFPQLQGRMVVELIQTAELNRRSIQIKRDAPGLPGLFSLDGYGQEDCGQGILRELEPRFVKVEASMLRDMERDPEKDRAVKELMEYAREQGAWVVAKGVETVEDLKAALEAGVSLLQGYLLSRPAAVPDPVSPDALAYMRAFWTEPGTGGEGR